MTQRNSYIRCTASEKESIRQAIKREFKTEPGAGIATGKAIAYMLSGDEDGE